MTTSRPEYFIRFYRPIKEHDQAIDPADFERDSSVPCCITRKEHIASTVAGYLAANPGGRVEIERRWPG